MNGVSLVVRSVLSAVTAASVRCATVNVRTFCVPPLAILHAHRAVLDSWLSLLLVLSGVCVLCLMWSTSVQQGVDPCATDAWLSNVGVNIY
jgi:hypothetical protein